MQDRERDIRETMEKYSDMVDRIALTRSGRVENAEDIFQNVFIKYSQKKPKFASEEHKKAWLIRVTINISKNFINQAWNRKVVNLDENLKFETQEENDVFSVVCELPEKYRTVIYLFYYEGYKVNEIAKLLKTKDGTVKTWLSRSREALREKLKGGFDDE